jgi:putative tricarboxylic transport membrane protein
LPRPGQAGATLEEPMEKKRKLQDGEGIFTWLLLFFSLFVLITAYTISGFSSISSPGTFPMFSGSVMVVTIIFLLVNNRKAEKPEADSIKEELRRAGTNVFTPVFLIYTAIIFIYMVVIQPLHFIPSSFAFLLISIIYLKGSTPLKATIISVITLAGIYFLFHFLFRVVLP